MAKGIPVVTLDRDVSNPADRVAFIGDNDVTLGREQTQYAISVLKQRHVKKPWHVVILQGTLGASTAIDRTKGAMDVLRPSIHSGAVKVVLNQSANFATATAESTISTELGKTADIQLIVCGNDAMALGAAGSLGLLLAIGALLCCQRSPSERGQLYHLLGVLIAFAIFGCTAGGFGTGFNLLGLGILRCYNRISIFIAFLALAALSAWLDAPYRRYS